MVTVAALAFAAWELTDHVILATADVFLKFAVAFAVETCLAITAIFWATRWSERAQEEQLRAERLAIVLASAMASEASDASPVAAALKALGDIGERTESDPEVHELVERAEKDVRKIRSTNRHLEETLSPLLET